MARPLIGGALLPEGASGALAPAQGAPDATAGDIIGTAQKREQNF
ncbi:MAG: hypothetical protein ACT6QT_11605 [Sphingopyxis sp.]|jgi:hypothetical protein